MTSSRTDPTTATEERPDPDDDASTSRIASIAGRVRSDEIWPAGIAALIAGLAASLVVGRMMGPDSPLVRGTNDYLAHVDRAEAISLHPWFMSVPHPAWHLLFLLLHSVLTTAVAVTAIAAAAAAAMAVVLWTVARSRWDDLPALSRPLAFTFALSYLLLENVAAIVPRGAGPILRLDLPGVRARGPGFFPLHTWGSPTMNLSLPLAMVTFLLVVAVVRGDRSRSGAHRSALLATAVLTALALPAAVLALVPASVLALLVSMRRDRWRFGVLAKWFLLPAIVLLLVQTRFLQSGVSVYENTTWRWNPLWPVRYFGMDRWSFWLVALPAVVALCVLGRRYLCDAGVQTALCCVAVTLPAGLLLQQTNPEKLMDGDLLMPLFFAVVFLVLVTVRLLLVEIQRRWRLRSARVPDGVSSVIVVALVLMVVAGVVDLGSAAGWWHEL